MKKTHIRNKSYNVELTVTYKVDLLLLAKNKTEAQHSAFDWNPETVIQSPVKNVKVNRKISCRRILKTTRV